MERIYQTDLFSDTLIFVDDRNGAKQIKTFNKIKDKVVFNNMTFNILLPHNMVFSTYKKSPQGNYALNKRITIHGSGAIDVLYFK